MGIEYTMPKCGDGSTKNNNTTHGTEHMVLKCGTSIIRNKNLELRRIAFQVWGYITPWLQGYRRRCHSESVLEGSFRHLQLKNALKSSSLSKSNREYSQLGLSVLEGKPIWNEKDNQWGRGKNAPTEWRLCSLQQPKAFLMHLRGAMC